MCKYDAEPDRRVMIVCIYSGVLAYYKQSNILRFLFFFFKLVYIVSQFQYFIVLLFVQPK